MQKILIPVMIFYTLSLSGQSKSVDRFRKEFREDNNVFIYSSTLQMLNAEKNPEFSDLVRDIEEIRVLNYVKANQTYKPDEIPVLRSNLKDEQYQELMILTEQDNRIYLYGREKKEKTIGFVALVENRETFMIIDVIGSLDIKQFMQLKNKLDTKL